MERSRLEQMGNSQLIKYAKYILTITKGERNLFDDINEFYQFIIYSGTEGSKKIMAPLGGNMSRGDIEYMFYVIRNNNLTDDDEKINRPIMGRTSADFVYDERVYRRTTRTGTIKSYLDDDLTSGYLETLKDESVIDPWDWEVTDEDEREWDVTGYWFDV